MDDQKCAKAKTEALARFADTGPDRINCSQAVLACALQVMGHDPDLVTLATFFGGGMASMGETCGAITGAVMAAGVRELHAANKDPERTQDTKEALQKAIRAFVDKFGYCRCRDLIGYDVSTPEGFAAFKASEAKERCPVYVGWMMDEITPLLCTDSAES